MGKGAPFEPCLLLSTADALPSAATVATEVAFILGTELALGLGLELGLP